MSLRHAVVDNPPRTLAAVIALAAPPLTIIVTRWVDGLLGHDPQLHAAVLAFAFAFVAYVASLVGKWAQRFTEPRHVFDELAAIKQTASFSGGGPGDVDRDEPPPALPLDPKLPPVPAPDELR